MSHDATKVLLGTTQSSLRKGSETFNSDPATFKAGLAVRRTSASALSVTKTDGGWVGISLGKDLADASKTTVLRAGLRCPILVSRQPARGSVTISSYANLLTTTPDTVTIGATAFAAQSGAATLGQAHFRAATSNSATATSLAAQINAHATAGALVVASIDASDATKVIITAKSNSSSGDTIALDYTDNGGGNVGASVSGATLDDSDDTADWITMGAKVYIADDTGMADDPNGTSTISDAVYVSDLLTGIAEDGTEVYCALVDFQGGL